VRPAYIPMYIIETTRQVPVSVSTASRTNHRPYYLVYTGIRDLRDTYFEAIINNNAMIYATLRGEKVWSQQDLWREWLHEKRITGVLPLERSDGTWQISLPVSVFEGPQAKFATTKVGEYDLRNGYLLQIWCDDRGIRRKAVLDRVLQMVKNQQRSLKKQTVQERLQLLAEQLRTDDVDFEDLRQRALETKMDTTVKVLDSL
jgi:phosphoglycerate-specific signal transduction histidine kinase